VGLTRVEIAAVKAGLRPAGDLGTVAAAIAGPVDLVGDRASSPARRSASS
jgi:hypothetical protein